MDGEDADGQEVGLGGVDILMVIPKDKRMVSLIKPRNRAKYLCPIIYGYLL